MALTTPISKKSSWRKGTVQVWFGHEVPDGIIAIELIHDVMRYGMRVHWRTLREIHEMPFEETDEGITAALVAMKLSC